MQDRSTSSGLTAALARVGLASLPTPLQAAPRLSAQVGAQIWIKHEDQSGLALGGNKLRQLEFLLGAALAKGAQAVVTTAALQSNFCRACAAAGARLGLKVGLLLRGDGQQTPQGNHLLDRIFGAELRFIATQDPYDPRIAAWLDEFASDFQQRGFKTERLHLPGQTGTLGAAAMVNLGEELACQFASQGLQPQALFLAAGSGLTLAGLVLAFKALRLPIRVVGISVQRQAGQMVPLIVQRANAAAQLLGLELRIDAEDFDFDDRFIGPGYGVPSPQGIEALLLAGRSEGLLLDPVYTGKALAGMLAQVRQGAWRDSSALVFLHSGGAPGLFANASGLAPALAH